MVTVPIMIASELILAWGIFEEEYNWTLTKLLETALARETEPPE